MGKKFKAAAIIMLLISDFKVEKKENTFNLIGKIKVQIMIIFAGAAIFILFAQLVYANNIATDGSKLSKIEQEIKEQEVVNSKIKLDIVKEASFNSISQKATSLGFEKPSQIIVPNSLLH